jgi:ATP-binding cassette subfamily F protein uup
MPILTAHGLRKSYGDRTLLADVAVSIHSRERVGLVGRNGSGKSTLARIVAGLDLPDAGEVATRREAVVSYLPQDPIFDPERTARDIVLEGLGAWKEAVDRHEGATVALARGEGVTDDLLAVQADASTEVERLGGWDRGHQVEALMSHLGVARPEAKVGAMSGGERRRVALARLLASEPDLAILDEPTNHLDLDAVEWLESYFVSTFKGALLLITHDRYLLDRVALRTLELDEGSLYSYDGGWSEYLEAKAGREAQEARTEANRQNFLRRELDWLSRSPSARSTKQKARIKRAEGAIEARAPSVTRAPELALGSPRLGHTVLELDGLALDVPGRRLVEELTLSLRKGERVGLVGPNGVGKTTLLRAITGDLTPAAGRLVLGKNTKVAYLDQSRSDLVAGVSVMENVAGKRDKVEVDGRTMDVRTYLARFLFPPQRVNEKVEALSGGERARVALGKLLLAPANLLLLDEPTNDLDVTTLGALEAMLLDAEATALVVSHDRYFLDRIATAILSFEGEGRVVLYQGSYSTYRALRVEAESERSAPKPVADEPRPKAERAPSRKKRLPFAEERELEGLPDAIEAAEKHLAEVTEQLSDPALYATRGEEVAALVAAQEAGRAEVERLLARWEALETRKAELEGS